MTITLTPFDAAEHLTEQSDQAALLSDAVATGDAQIIAAAIGIVARAQGMTGIEQKTGIKRQALYRAFGPKGNPTLETIMRILPVLGLQLQIAPTGDAIPA